MTANRPSQRQKASQDAKGHQAIQDIKYNDKAGADKTIKTMGYLVPLGSLATAVDLKSSGKTISLYNNSGVVAFVAASILPTIAAPTGFTDGIALAPNQYTTITLTEETYIRASAATVYGYEVLDDTYWVK